MIKFIGNESALSGWIAAEGKLAGSKAKPIPKGWITVADYAEARNLSGSQARKILKALYDAELADRQKWIEPIRGGAMFIYRLTHSRNGKR